MSQDTEKFATVINCMDGRAVRSVLKYFEDEHDIPYPDMITHPGVDGHFGKWDTEELEKVREKILISVGHHGSRIIAFVGHDECAGNPVSKEEHFRAITQGIDTLSRWDFDTNDSLLFLGLWVEKTDGVWQTKCVCRLSR